jgi:predicted transglutaminase-like cysteine proteinase
MRKLVLAACLVGVSIWSLEAFSRSIAKEYKWESMGRTWTLTQAYAFEAYHRFKTLPRVSDYAEYADYIQDPSDDAALDTLVSELEALAGSAGFDSWETLTFVVSFVQSLRYVPEEGEYPRYPIETLVEGCGDCEDLAILAAAILEQMGFDVVLLAFKAEMHMAVGVRVSPPDAVGCQAYEWRGADYYYLETTGTGWTIGRVPARFTSTPDIIAVSSGF